GGSNAAAAAAVAGLVVYIIEKHEASERQKRIADERARRAYANMSPKRKAALKAKKVRYIAVDTEKNDKTSPQAKKSVMVWDTEKQEVAGNHVYDVKKSPTVGETAKFDKYSAEYVGSGSQSFSVHQQLLVHVARSFDASVRDVLLTSVPHLRQTTCLPHRESAL